MFSQPSSAGSRPARSAGPRSRRQGGVEVTSPDDHEKRGGNVSFRSPGAGSVVEALIAAGVVSSFRKPDAIRFGVSPLVIRHQDCWEAVQRLKRILADGIWKKPEFSKVSV